MGIQYYGAISQIHVAHVEQYHVVDSGQQIIVMHAHIYTPTSRSKKLNLPLPPCLLRSGSYVFDLSRMTSPPELSVSPQLMFGGSDVAQAVAFHQLLDQPRQDAPLKACEPGRAA